MHHPAGMMQKVFCVLNCSSAVHRFNCQLLESAQSAGYDNCYWIRQLQYGVGVLIGPEACARFTLLS